jgi:hypothetical protein
MVIAWSGHHCGYGLRGPRPWGDPRYRSDDAADTRIALRPQLVQDHRLGYTPGPEQQPIGSEHDLLPVCSGLLQVFSSVPRGQGLLGSLDAHRERMDGLALGTYQTCFVGQLDDIGSLALLLGFLFYGGSTLRGRVLPRWCGAAFLSGFLGWVVLAISLGDTGGVLGGLWFGAVWIALGHALWTHDDGATPHPAA